VHGKGTAPSASARPEESSGQTDAACGRPIPSTRKSCASRPPPVPLASLDQRAFPKPSAAAAGDTVGAQCLPLNAAAAAMSSTCWRPPTPPTSSMLCSHRRGTTSCARRSADQSDRTAGEEYMLRAFWREHCGGWVIPEALDDWWVADHYKNPTWDLIAVRSLCVDAADLDGLCIRDRCFPLTCNPAGDDRRSYRWNECPHCQGSSPL
jgi:hypothetical protein